MAFGLLSQVGVERESELKAKVEGRFDAAKMRAKTGSSGST